jgi:hypothetical protein
LPVYDNWYTDYASQVFHLGGTTDAKRLTHAYIYTATFWNTIVAPSDTADIPGTLSPCNPNQYTTETDECADCVPSNCTEDRCVNKYDSCRLCTDELCEGCERFESTTCNNCPAKTRQDEPSYIAKDESDSTCHCTTGKVKIDDECTCHDDCQLCTGELDYHCTECKDKENDYLWPGFGICRPYCPLAFTLHNPRSNDFDELTGKRRCAGYNTRTAIPFIYIPQDPYAENDQTIWAIENRGYYFRTGK